MNQSPIIGITLDYVDNQKGYSDFPYYAIRRHYSSVLAKHGALPIFLPFESYSNGKNILDHLSGILVPGGDAHVPPGLYGENARFSSDEATDRCEFEVKLLQKAMDIDMPILGICHGMQLLNVIFGGSLHQNLEDEIGAGERHYQKISRLETKHSVSISPNTKLSAILGNDEFMVNSTHTQAVKALGKNLEISAKCSEDGVIEAIESKIHEFVLGIEWHPEIEASTKQDNKIMEAFLNAARNYQQWNKIS
jgi:putative glutamine amidotransferase